MGRLLSYMFVLLFSKTVYSEVVVHKCCKDNFSLNSKLECSDDTSEHWAPAVYSAEKGGFLDPGTVPDDWVYDQYWPTCLVPDYAVLAKNESPPFVLLSNGSLLKIKRSEEPTTDYCIDRTGALICLKSDGLYVQKCCGRGGEWSETNSSCVSSITDHPEFKDLRTIHRLPECSEPSGDYVISGKLNSTYWLQEDGNLKDSGGRILPLSQFCLEKIVEYPNESPHVFTCPPPRFSTKHDIRFTIYPIGLCLSVFFLAVTLIASCLLPSTYHVLHWRCQTNHVACLLIGDFLLAVTQLSKDAFQGPACVAIAISMHFIFLAAFFWLNTMCFNIWWTFRDLRPASLDKGQEACRLRSYEIYAWGGPLLISGIAGIFYAFPDFGPDILRPKFGVRRCFFDGDVELLYYFYGPIGVLLFMNLTLFAATARELTCGLWKTEVVKSNTERATLGRVCLKLVVVMGVTWSADVISWAVGGPDYVWYLTDIINALQGVMIFAVVGCQPQVWSGMKKLWCLSSSPNDNQNARSSSSHAMPSVNDQNTSTTNSQSKPAETLC